MPLQENLDMDLLRAFVAVAEAGSFTRAAGCLGRVQSAVSMQVKRLEETVGQRLFDRGRRAVTLTAEGEILISYARRMISLNQEALFDLGRTRIEGVVRLGTADTASYFLPGILGRFARAYPRVQVEVRCDRSWLVLDALEVGDLDLALVTQPCGRSGGQLLRREPLVWAAARGEAAQKEDPLPLALFAQGCAYRNRAMAALDAVGRPWRMAYSSTSVTGVQAAVLTGLAVAILPQSTLLKGMRVLGLDEGLPPLCDYELTLHCSVTESSQSAARLANDISAQLAVPVESGELALPVFAVAE